MASAVHETAVARARLVATTAALLGIDQVWGWQLHALALVLSRRPDGGPQYRNAALVLCRQTGKTVLLQLLCLWALSSGLRVLFTAHERQKARDKWDEVATAMLTVLPHRTRRTLAPGRERLDDLATGGQLMLVTPDDAGGRSHTADLVIVDEAAHIKPAFLRSARLTLATRLDAQIVMISSGMTDDSHDLAAALDTAAAHQPLDAAGRSFGALVWGAKLTPGVDGVDLDDPKVWAAAIPTLAEPGGVTVAAVADARESMPADDFARELLSIPTGSPLTAAISEDAWGAVTVTDMAPTASLRRRVIAVDTDPDQTHTSIATAGIDPDGRCWIAVLSDAAGDDWLWDDLVDACAAVRPDAVIIDAMSPAARIADRATASGRIDVTITGAPILARSCASMLAAVHAGTVAVVADDALTAAALTAIRRPVADAGWAWRRRHRSAVPITALVAASLAHHDAVSHSR